MSDNASILNASKITHHLEDICEVHASILHHGVAILAGNPALVSNRKNNQINLIEQAASFKAALIAREFFEKKGIPVFISILFDHLKPWPLFLNNCKQERLKEDPLITLDDMLDEIKYPFLEICKAYHYSLKDFQVIFEGMCRNQAQQWLDGLRKEGSSELAPEFASLYSALIRKVTPSKLDGCNEMKERVSCKGIAGQCIVNTNNYAGFDIDKFGIFIGYWDDDPIRCDHNFIIGGKEIAQKHWNVRSDIYTVILKKNEQEKEGTTFHLNEVIDLKNCCSSV